MNKKALILLFVFFLAPLVSSTWYDSSYEYRHNITQTNTSHDLLGPLNGFSAIDEGYDNQKHWVYGTWRGVNSEFLHVYHQDTSGGGWNQTIVANNTHEYCVIQTQPENYTSCPKKPEGLIAYWTLDENIGNAWEPISGDDGTPSGATQGADGKIGNAYSFDGSDDYVEIPNNIATSSYYSSFTMSGWAKTDNPTKSGGQVILSLAGDAATAFRISQNGDAQVSIFDGSNTHRISGGDINSDTWYLITATYDGSKLRLYVNGQKVNETSSNDPSTGSGDSVIGEYGNNRGKKNFNGTLDDLRLYKRALSSSEIEALYHNKASLGREDIPFAGGSGTSSDPYEIDNVDQLQEMERNLTAHYELISDINATETKNWNSGKGFDPIGSHSDVFKGELNGKGHVIENLTIDRNAKYQGLFAETDTGSKIHKIGLRNVDIQAGFGDNVGGIAGHAKGEIKKVYVTGKTSGDYLVGGLVGEAYATINQSYSRVEVKGDNHVGGLIGDSELEVTRSYSTGNVAGNNNVGGLIGSNVGTVSDSYWDINTSGQNTSDGGTGLSSPEIKNKSNLGGFDFNNVWEYVDGANDNYPVLQIFNHQPQPPEASFTIDQNSDSQKDVFLARANIQFRDNFSGGTSYSWNWDNGETGKGENPAYSYSSPGTYNVSMNASNSQGWDLYWREIEIIDPYAGGSGTQNNPWQIDNCGQLQNMTKDKDAYFELISDINCTGTENWNSGNGFKPVGGKNDKFEGKLNGKGYLIHNLTIKRDSKYQGLFAALSTDSKIQEVGMVNVSIDAGLGDYIGAVAGDIGGATLNQTYASGKIKAHWFTGGLAGEGNGKIVRSYARVDIESNGDQVGGLIGENEKKIIESYSTGNVTGNNNVGGLIGRNFGTVSESYWDINTSGQNTSDGGTGLTTPEMKDKGNLSGFNFTTTWEFVTGVNDGYPVLQIFNHTAPGKSPQIIDIAPNSTNRDPSSGVKLEAEIGDPDSSEMNITFYDNSDDSQIGKIEDVDNGTHSIKWTGLSSDQEYKYYAKVTDGANAVTSNTYSFTTIDIKLEWNDNSANENGFRIYNNASGKYRRVYSAGKDRQKFTSTNSGLEFGKYTCYKVTAYNIFGGSKPTKACITPGIT